MKQWKIYKDGRIWSKKHKRFINQRDNGTGYLTVNLPYRSGRYQRQAYVHRIIAKKYVLNPDNFRYVNHKDGNKHNNHMNNLEWCTAQMNRRHSAGDKEYYLYIETKAPKEIRLQELILAGIDEDRARYALDM